MSRENDDLMQKAIDEMNRQFPKRRVKMVIEFEADLDPVSGMFDNSDDWMKVIEHDLKRNRHYNPSVTFRSIVVKKGE